MEVIPKRKDQQQNMPSRSRSSSTKSCTAAKSAAVCRSTTTPKISKLTESTEASLSDKYNEMLTDLQKEGMNGIVESPELPESLSEQSRNSQNKTKKFKGS